MAKKKLAKSKKKTKLLSKKKGGSKKKLAAKRKKKVLAVPKGYNSVTPYLILNNAAQAIDFYKRVFGAKEVMRMEQPNGRVGHAELKIGDTKIMLADEFPEMDARSPQTYGGTPVSIHLYVKDVDSVVDKAVSAGATLKRPIENMFYGDRSSTLEDPYGHKWHISTHVEDVSMATIRKRAAELFDKKD